MSETGLLPAYLIVGTDGVKRDHAVSRMKARLEKSGMVEFNLDERDMSKDPDIESIIGSLNTFPMGSEFRLVILDGCSKLAKAVSEPLVEYFESQPHDGLPYHRRLTCQEHASVQGGRKAR